MGNDGGTINKVHRLQLTTKPDRTKSPVEQDLRQFQDASIWTCCRLSNKKLHLPIVSDCRGNLLNKESVLEWLLTPEKEDFNKEQIEQFAHIKRLNDVVDLNGIQETEDGIRSEFSGDILGDKSIKFIYLISCGDVLPKSSLRLSAKTKMCPHCGKSYEDGQIITINPSIQELGILNDRIHKMEKDDIHHNGKLKSKKRKRTVNTGNDGGIKKTKGPK